MKIGTLVKATKENGSVMYGYFQEELEHDRYLVSVDHAGMVVYTFADVQPGLFVENIAIGDECEFYDDGEPGSIFRGHFDGVRFFDSNGVVWDKVRKIKKQHIQIKQISDLIKTLLEMDCKPDRDGDWIYPDGIIAISAEHIFDMSGTVVSSVKDRDHWMIEE